MCPTCLFAKLHASHLLPFFLLTSPPLTKAMRRPPLQVPGPWKCSATTLPRHPAHSLHNKNPSATIKITGHHHSQTLDCLGFFPLVRYFCSTRVLVFLLPTYWGIPWGSNCRQGVAKIRNSKMQRTQDLDKFRLLNSIIPYIMLVACIDFLEYFWYFLTSLLGFVFLSMPLGNACGMP